MLSRREKLLIRPWEDQRFENHKRKIQSAQPAIDFKMPPVYSHVTNKLKKIQTEKERAEKINRENIRLLQRLGNIMTTKRLENFWKHPRPNFLNREKIDFNRPNTCKGRMESLADTIDLPTSSSYCSSKFSAGIIDRRTFSAKRCPTCSGKPEKPNLVIPEERIPWEPPRKSWNRKIYTDEFNKCCINCFK